MKALKVLPRRWRAKNNRAEDSDVVAGAGEPSDSVESQAGEESSDEPRFVWTTASSAWVTRVCCVGLWAAVGAGVVALLLVVTGYGQQPVSTVEQSRAEDPRADERAAVSAFAGDFVTTWLSTPMGQEQRLGEYLAVPDSVTLPRRPWVASAASVSGIEETSSGTWSVTVAVDVTPGPAAQLVRRYFRVAVLYSEGAMTAQALPAPVAAPRLATPVELNYPEQTMPTSAVVVAAGDFLSALLTGDADLTRFVSPGAQIAPVLPPPYKVVTVADAYADVPVTDAAEKPETGAELRLLVTADVAAAGDQEISVQYALTMRAREGRWEVATVDPAPALDPDRAQPESEVPGDGGSDAAGTEGEAG